MLSAKDHSAPFGESRLICGQQMRLNNVMTLHIHKDLTDVLDLLQIDKEFVSASEHRKSTFGRFLPTD